MSVDRVPTRVLLVVGLLVALVVAGGVSLLASGSPDGLEKVAADKGFADHAQEHAAADSPLADYTTRGIDDEGAAGAIAGVTGTLVVLGLGSGLFFMVRRRERDPV